MKQKIKMIAFDCDGTLLNDRKEMTEYTRNVLIRAIEQGIEVLAATGRPLSGVPKEVRNLPGVRYAITSNGARIVDMKEEKVLYESSMSVETGKQVLDIFSQYDTYKEVFLEGNGYCNAHELEEAESYVILPSMAVYLRECRIPVPDVYKKLENANLRVDKVHALFKNRNEKEKAFQQLEKIPQIAATGAMENNIEVNAFGVNKGEGILKLGEFLGIAREEIMACGDGMNDLEMVREAGLGVAMENAVQPVKDAADYITVSNEEDGVAKAIEKFALIEE